MDSWNRLLALLDQTLGFPNRIRSTVKKKWQSFDQRTGEHVFVLEYRIKVKPGVYPPEKSIQSPRDLHTRAPARPIKPAKPVRSMNTIRELMDVRFVNTVDSSPSPASNGSGKKTTIKKPAVPKKTRPNPTASPIKPV
jgi:hypothetical protein